MKMKPWIVAVAMLVVGAVGALVLFQRPGAQAAGTALSTATQDASLAVSVTGILGSKGSIYAAVCDQASFLKQCSYNQAVKVNASGSLLLGFEHLPPGAYALMLYHDENDNHQFDKGSNGIPVEGYGFSRNARGHFGPPLFEDAAISIKPGAQDIAIEMRY